ncbi:MAG: hypothetical protein EVA65_13605 [Oceanococcus sp.]|nr:MAG: hypothetical protein EVA65_13605 [Oceanococcus sp.]
MRIFVLICLLCLGACSHQRMYESSEDMREQYCENLDEHAREACLDQARMPYEQYEQERQDSMQTHD